MRKQWPLSLAFKLSIFNNTIVNHHQWDWKCGQGETIRSTTSLSKSWVPDSLTKRTWSPLYRYNFVHKYLCIKIWLNNGVTWLWRLGSGKKETVKTVWHQLGGQKGPLGPRGLHSPNHARSKGKPPLFLNSSTFLYPLCFSSSTTPFQHKLTHSLSSQYFFLLHVPDKPAVDWKQIASVESVRSSSEPLR